MVALVVPFLLALIAIGAKASPWSDRPRTGRVTVNRVANVILWLAVGWELGLAANLLGKASAWPHVTLDDLAKLGPVATAAAAIVALIVGSFTVWQRGNADRRDQWWERTRWALDLAIGDDSKGTNRSEVGMATLTYQLRSRLAKTEETEFLSTCVVSILSPTIDLVADAIAETSPSLGSGEGEVPSERKNVLLGPDQEEGSGHGG
jgi:hypothetical protein